MTDRSKQLRAGVRKDGTVEGCIVETYLAEIYALRFPAQYSYEVDHDNRFIAFQIDNGGTDLEARLPFEIIEEMKTWIDGGPKS